jgi:hypothetical protein
MAKYGTTFKGYPVLSFPIDSPDELYDILKSKGVDVKQNLDNYYKYIYKDKIEPLLFHSPYKMNLGGENDKQRIITTERTSGIFDFSLASKTLQKDVEYYSDTLAKDYPDRFENMGLLSGIVPDDYITNFPVQGKPNFIFQDKILNKDFVCQQRQKGETAIQDGVQGATLAFKSNTRKTYKTYKRQKGKVRYVEIYSLFYYTSLSGDVQYAIRHIPAILAAQYFESIGIKTRIYMTRFVLLSEGYKLKKKDSVTGMELPLYDMVKDFGYDPDSQRKALFVQPFCVKDFGQEFDPLLGFAMSQQDPNIFYAPAAKYSLKRESDIFDVMGKPDWTEFDYFEGIDRFRTKFQQYTDLGIFKGKEVLPEAMIFFHDYSIKSFLPSFQREFTNYLNSKNIKYTDVYLNPEVNAIFSWWMKALGNKIKHKIDLLNSNGLSNDIRKIDADLTEARLEAENLVSSANDSALKMLYQQWYTKLLNAMNIRTLYEYITAINNEITAYSQGFYFPTSDEDVEKRDDYAQNINESLNSYL